MGTRRALLSESSEDSDLSQRLSSSLYHASDRLIVLVKVSTSLSSLLHTVMYVGEVRGGGLSSSHPLSGDPSDRGFPHGHRPRSVPGVTIFKKYRKITICIYCN